MDFAKFLKRVTVQSVTKQYRKTLIARTDPKEYARKYYEKYLKRDAKTPDLRHEKPSDWMAALRKQAANAARNRSIPFEVTRTQLHEQWDRQQGRCFYTGILMDRSTAVFRGMRRPSLDRIDSSLGYVIGNVVFCLIAINYLKNDYPAEDVCELLNEIVDQHRYSWNTPVPPATPSDSS